MRVLWFTTNPSMAEDHLKKTPSNGGWIKSLEKEMREKVDLSIAFYYQEDITNIQSGKTKYYPIINKQNKSLIGKIEYRILKLLEPKSDLKKFNDIIEEVKPDLIHIHGTELPFGLVQKATSIPTVISIQGVISVYAYKYFSGIPHTEVLKHSSLKNRLFFRSAISRFKRFKKEAEREKAIYKISKHFIGRTDWDKRITKTLAPNANYYHNDEILRSNFYEDSWKNTLNETINLFTTTGTNLYKGIETLIYCASLLDQNNVKFTWKVAGVNSTDDIVRIAVKSIRKKLSPNIEFLGKVYEETVKKEILNCNIYVCVSHIENSPNSLCEALILGAPCISTHAGGVPNFIKDKETGLLIQDGDPYSMAGAIVEVAENYESAILFGQTARKEALIRHDKEKISADLLEIYNSILNRNATTKSVTRLDKSSW